MRTAQRPNVQSGFIVCKYQVQGGCVTSQLLAHFIHGACVRERCATSSKNICRATTGVSERAPTFRELGSARAPASLRSSDTFFWQCRQEPPFSSGSETHTDPAPSGGGRLLHRASSAEWSLFLGVSGDSPAGHPSTFSRGSKREVNFHPHSLEVGRAVRPPVRVRSAKRASFTQQTCVRTESHRTCRHLQRTCRRQGSLHLHQELDCPQMCSFSQTSRRSRLQTPKSNFVRHRPGEQPVGGHRFICSQFTGAADRTRLLRSPLGRRSSSGEGGCAARWRAGGGNSWNRRAEGTVPVQTRSRATARPFTLVGDSDFAGTCCFEPI